jgi:hypothetical protein
MIAVFSISLTAGTIYFGYSKVKEFTINKLVRSWTDAKEILKQSLTSEQQVKLKVELDKLFIWDIRLLATLTSKIQNKASDSEKAIIIKKLIEKKVFEKANLRDVSEFLEYEKQIA